MYIKFFYTYIWLLLAHYMNYCANLNILLNMAEKIYDTFIKR